MVSEIKQIILKIQPFFRDKKRIIILGIGSDQRADDAAGVQVVRNLMKILNLSKFPNIMLLECGTAPENFTGVIKGFRPDLILIFDAADMDESQGTIRQIDGNEIGGVSFSSHQMPLPVLMSYLTAEMACEALLIGIQPENLEFYGKMNEKVKKAVKEIVLRIKELIR
jgi:hydrogenase 3 maturation protease